jgi:hypothetical protein
MSSQINCGYLATIQGMADEIWVDPILNADAKADVNAIKAVLENQAVNFQSLTDPRKDRIISVEWLEPDCSTEVTDCTDDCEFDGVDTTPVCKEYELDLCKEITFKVPYKAYRTRTIDRQKAIAHNLVQKMKRLDNEMAAAVVAAAVANAGVNEFTGGIGNVVGNNTEIPSAYWNSAMFGYFAQVGIINKFTSPYLIDGNNLWQMVWQAQQNQGNDNGKGAFQMVNSMKVYSDPFIMNTTAPGITLMLHKTALAFVHKTYYPMGMGSAENMGGKQWLWSMPSYNIPGVSYDVIMNQECEGNDWYDVFKIQVNAGVFANPTGCSDDRTGMLTFECV